MAFEQTMRGIRDLDIGTQRREREAERKEKTDADWALEKRGMERRLFETQMKRMAREASAEDAKTKALDSYDVLTGMSKDIEEVLSTDFSSMPEDEIKEKLSVYADKYEDPRHQQLFGQAIQGDYQEIYKMLDVADESLSRKYGIKKTRKPNVMGVGLDGKAVSLPEGSRLMRHKFTAKEQDAHSAGLEYGTPAWHNFIDPKGVEIDTELASYLPPDKQQAYFSGEATQEQRNFLEAEAEKTKRDEEKQAKTKGKASVAELKAGGFYTRMLEDESKLSQVLADNPDFSPSSGWESMRGWTNFTASPQYQLYENASQDWIRAKLRQESGAVISDDEAASEYDTYFPVFGDSKAEIAQKIELRKTAAEGMKQAAGRAYTPPGELPIPNGVTEDDITKTMKTNNMTRAQVLERLYRGR